MWAHSGPSWLSIFLVLIRPFSLEPCLESPRWQALGSELKIETMDNTSMFSFQLKLEETDLPIPEVKAAQVRGTHLLLMKRPAHVRRRVD